MVADFLLSLENGLNATHIMCFCYIPIHALHIYVLHNKIGLFKALAACIALQATGNVLMQYDNIWSISYNDYAIILDCYPIF